MPLLSIAPRPWRGHDRLPCRPAPLPHGAALLRRARLGAVLCAALAAGAAPALAQDTLPAPPQLPQLPQPPAAPAADPVPRPFVPELAPPDSAAERLALAFGAAGLKVFGRDLFTRSTTQFQAVGTGPVDPAYRLGPGDQLVLVLTGEVEFAHTLEVTREGTIVVPQVGQVVVQGLTLPEVEDRLYAQLSRVFSGVGRGPGATTQFNTSLGKLRSSQVFLAGEVERPGAYQVSSVATAFNALYQARGPNVHGSYRAIEVRRGGTLVQTVDVYDYLLRGDSRRDVRLEQGDLIFVPLAGRQVAVTGPVRRPAIYELLPGEDLRHLLEFAGGLEAAASMGRIQVDRILPAGERRAGVDRVLIDVDLRELAAGVPFPLQDRDLIHVFDVSEQRRNRIVLAGEVVRPGVYEWTPGMTLWSLLDRADGLTPSTYTPRAHVYRSNPEDGSRFLLRVPLATDSAGGRGGDIRLADSDSVVIYSRADLRNPRTVTISGFVKQPGTYPLAEGMSVRDLILSARGLSEGADPSGVELMRMTDPAVRGDTVARVTRLTLGRAEIGRGASPLETPLWIPAGREVELQDGDLVLVRRAPGYQPGRVVKVTGEILQPGPYPLDRRSTRLLEVLARAGGPTAEADLAGLQVVREGLPVGTDYAAALRNPESRFNVALESGDSIHLPSRDQTVKVVGAVGYESRVLYVPGRSVDEYVAQAGGYTHRADRRRVIVTYPDGERSTARSLLFWTSDVRVTPGSTIVVPAKPEDATAPDWTEVASRVTQVLGSVITVWIAIDRLSQ